MKKAIEHMLVYILDTIEQYNNKDKQPTLLAYNIAWFTDCSWLSQINAFRQVDLYR